MKYLKNIYCILGVIITLATLWGIYYAVDVNLAKAADLKRVEVKVDRFIISQEINQYQTRIWKIEEMFGKDVNRMTPQWRNEYRCLQRDLSESRRKEQALNK